MLRLVGEEEIGVVDEVSADCVSNLELLERGFFSIGGCWSTG